MLFYQIKKEADQVRTNRNFLVAEELYTQKEMIKYNIDSMYAIPIRIKKHNTHFFFGARFINNNI